MEKQPSVRMMIWCDGSVHYAHTQVNANPHDERLKYKKQMGFFQKLFNPWLVIYNEETNKSYVIKKSSIVIMEFQWEEQDDQES